MRVHHPADPVLIRVVADAAGRPVDEVGTLLGDAPVHDDTALTELASALDALEEEVRRP
jgi:hypothetical protein